MAMIKCPKCGENISDKSTKCVHCNKVLGEEPKKTCEECGNELKKKDKVCSKCGCPVSTENEPQKVELTKVKLGKPLSKKKIIIIISIILLIIGVAIGVTVVSKKSAEDKAEKIKAEYEDNLHTITLKMLNGAVLAEDCGNLIKQVWSNTIWKKSSSETDKFTKPNGYFNSDFNESLTNLFKDSSFSSDIQKIEDNQEEVNKLMKEMKNPPEEWEDAYSVLKEFYDSYLTLTNLAISPSGSLQTFSSNFNDADTKTSTDYNKLKPYLDY